MSNRTESRRAMRLPNPPVPMTSSILMAYLETMADSHNIEYEPVMINGEEVVNAKVVDGRVVLQTYKDMLDENPPCKHHNPVQHRDGKPPWCYLCRLTTDWKNPHGKAS
ncbi:hypothetical protein SEA_ODESZA_62 [Gordonia Phage Odesza]|uniref:Uncharacterized protein n=3 Tax=Tanisvirus tanis TaxID=2844677 RepID=A0A7D5KT98_9CAUD|nr:hypothetical protein HWC73_gp63 [Gordonia phage Tanis]QGJ89673.1 hypothetical protein SEA_ODESZA_62 [Gordonia Phage Odesza]QKY78734.1 hypothetical protein SEA_GILL_63 [Gordonia phage Gill]QLF83780.1 hypothetical protein SEA_MAGEL_64 [Gordonia phage Magel]QYW00702.1 hypothetical protein SEA_RONEY_63 [Gordonia phage Roney]QFP95637.1 hypothetical protein SEA_TANIS_63 [Gordonia phage Tanis]